MADGWGNKPRVVENDDGFPISRLSSAHDEVETETAKEILEDLIHKVKALDDNETTEAILRKAEAVHGTSYGKRNEGREPRGPLPTNI